MSVSVCECVCVYLTERERHCVVRIGLLGAAHDECECKCECEYECEYKCECKCEFA